MFSKHRQWFSVVLITALVVIGVLSFGFVLVHNYSKSSQDLSQQQVNQKVLDYIQGQLKIQAQQNADRAAAVQAFSTALNNENVILADIQAAGPALAQEQAILSAELQAIEAALRQICAHIQGCSSSSIHIVPTTTSPPPASHPASTSPGNSGKGKH